MNYLSEINGFERWLETHQLPTLAQLLWYKLIYWSSRSGWPEWTQVDNRRLMVSLQIAREASLTESRERLVNAGLIEYQKGKKGKIKIKTNINLSSQTVEKRDKGDSLPRGCDRRFRSEYRGLQTITFWEMLDCINGLKLPDYKGLTVSIHDSCSFLYAAAPAKENRGAFAWGIQIFCPMKRLSRQPAESRKP